MIAFSTGDSPLAEGLPLCYPSLHRVVVFPLSVMAIFYQKISIVSRSNGHSAVKAAAYQSRENIRHERTGSNIDYSAKQDLIHKGIVAPGGAADWVFQREELWNRAEAAEKRKDAQLARKIIMALPHELPMEQQQHLLEEYLQKNFVDKGMVADYAIHAPEQGGDERNMHAHVLLTMRPLDGDGFAAKKNRSWNKRNLVEEWRASWAEETNRQLAALGLEETIDHRSYKRQGSSKLAQKHMGKQATHTERRTDKTTRVGDYNRAVDAINELQELLEQQADDDNKDVLELFGITLTAIEEFQNTPSIEGLFQGPLFDRAVVENRRQSIREQRSHKSGPLERSSRVFSPSRASRTHGNLNRALLQRQRFGEPNTYRESQAIYKANRVGRYYDQLNAQSNPSDTQSGNQQGRRGQPNPVPMTAEPRDAVNSYRYYLYHLGKQSANHKMAQHYNRHSEMAFKADLYILRKLRERGFSQGEIRRAFRRANPALYGKSYGHARLYTRKFEAWMRRQRKEQTKQQMRSKPREQEERYERRRRRK